MTDENKSKATGRPTKSKWRPRVPKSKLWTKDEAREMAKLAQKQIEEKASAEET